MSGKRPEGGLKSLRLKCLIPISINVSPSILSISDKKVSHFIGLGAAVLPASGG
ncbi:hypothetical protein C8N47_13514 [Mangrovibacterium marinum]|uniref:Uncharacterized protein n=1 Tax=Mangrovibacterium marinum TaxID=1639118 RepID=A0A2T5BV66_9BACT|nr:hypothetical protein C8N47_13514 [Mangrovibacterium marinum]